MSGSIKIDEQKVWIANGWFYRSALSEFVAVLSESGACPTILEYLQNPNGNPQTIDYVDLTKRSRDERVAFREAAATAVRRWYQRGCLDWNRPDLFPKYMQHFEKLVTQLDEDRSHNAA
jgi:hypothetical protein